MPTGRLLSRSDLPRTAPPQPRPGRHTPPPSTSPTGPRRPVGDPAPRSHWRGRTNPAGISRRGRTSGPVTRSPRPRSRSRRGSCRCPRPPHPSGRRSRRPSPGSWHRSTRTPSRRAPPLPIEGTGPFDPLVDPLPVLDPSPPPIPPGLSPQGAASRAAASTRYPAVVTALLRRSTAPQIRGGWPRTCSRTVTAARPGGWPRTCSPGASTDRAPEGDSATTRRAADLLADRDAGHGHGARRRDADSSTGRGRGPAHNGGARIGSRDAADEGVNDPAASRWLAADLLNGGGGEGRAPTDRDDPEPSRWLAADLLNGRSGIDGSEDGRQAPQSASMPEGQHLGGEATGSRWQAADLLASQRRRAGPARRRGSADRSRRLLPRTWRAAELLKRERE